MAKRILSPVQADQQQSVLANAITDPDVEIHAADIDPFAPGLYLVPPDRRHLLRAARIPVRAEVAGALCRVWFCRGGSDRRFRAAASHCPRSISVCVDGCSCADSR